ncbi:hypothetical protein HMPREF1092_01647 [Clostridium thermobutyricum]|uniref:Uncharacterized protein n=1 Tax=Clostridium thermobutyricum TaxID=29372 RepID=N9Y3J3_9CLOT|nr:hypothetical protein [Clostridium thermobutyricum]ENZ02412.1 hypothetical protein HMPREF1092_01647 [Clostridium thermobutyricum]
MRYKPMTMEQYKGYCIINVILGILTIIGCFISRIVFDMQFSMLVQVIITLIFLILNFFLSFKMNKYRL